MTTVARLYVVRYMGPIRWMFAWLPHWELILICVRFPFCGYEQTCLVLLLVASTSYLRLRFCFIGGIRDAYQDFVFHLTVTALYEKYTGFHNSSYNVEISL